MKTSTAERIIRSARRYGSRKVKVLVKRGGALPPEFLAAHIRRWNYPMLEGAKDIGGMIVADIREVARKVFGQAPLGPTLKTVIHDEL